MSEPLKKLRVAIKGNAYEWRFAIKELPGMVWWDPRHKCWFAECSAFDPAVFARFEQRLGQLERVGLQVIRLDPDPFKQREQLT